MTEQRLAENQNADFRELNARGFSQMKASIQRIDQNCTSGIVHEIELKFDN